LIWWSLQSSYCHNVLVSVSTFLDFWKIGIIFIFSFFLLVLLHKKWGEKEKKISFLGPSILKNQKQCTEMVKVGMITLGMWYKVLWSPKLIQKSKQKAIYSKNKNNQSYQIIIGNLKSQTSQKILFSGQNNWNVLKCTFVTQKMSGPQIFIFKNFLSQGIISHT